MRLFGAMEYLIVTVGNDGTLHGMRLQRRHKRLTVIRALEVPPDERSAADRLADLCRKLDRRRDMTLVIGAAFPGAVFFRSRMPEMSPRELASALQFEVPQQVLKLPPEWALQFTADPADEEGMLNVGVQVTPREELNRLCDLLAELRLQVDDCISPFLALPELPAGSRVFLPLFEPDFYWADGSFHPAAAGIHCNDEAVELLKKEFDFSDGYREENFRKFLPELLIARFVAAPGFRHRKAGLELLPKQLRPQRLRSQLRLAVILLVLLLGMWLWNAGGNILSFHSEYSSITSRTAGYKSRTTEIQRRMRSRDKELKEMNRVLEQNFGDREMPVTLARIANVIPAAVLVSSFRITDTGIDLTLHTTQENLDIGPALRKVPGFKVATLQSRKVNDTLSMITVKLNRTGEVK